MIKNLITSLFLIICISFLGCTKSGKPVVTPTPVPPKIKLSLFSGDNQTDTIGNPLPNPIIVSVTKDGEVASGYTVQFQGSGCNEDDVLSTLSGPDGSVNYIWSLAGNVGQQSLKIYVLDSKNQKADSVTVSATAVATTSGWHRSGCSIQAGASPPVFCKLSTGRLFTCFNGKTYLRYSDDNGASWYAVKSLGNTHAFSWVLSTPSDEILAFTEGTDGTFYSNDGGQTWSNLGVPPFNTELFSSIVCTQSGKIMAATALDPPFSISIDKGKTWSTSPFSAFVPQNMVQPTFHDPAEDKDGNLYIIELQDQNLYMSQDLGKTWKLQPPASTSIPGTDEAFYIDKNNWFYRSINSPGYGLYISKDKGVTYDQLIPYSVGKISVQSDGDLYYIAAGQLFQYDFTNKIGKKLFGDGLETTLSAYIIANNNNVIVNNLGKPYILYHTN